MIVSEADFLRFCHEDEENDQSEEFEEYLACSVCGDNGTCILMSSMLSMETCMFFRM